MGGCWVTCEFWSQGGLGVAVGGQMVRTLVAGRPPMGLVVLAWELCVGVAVVRGGRRVLAVGVGAVLPGSGGACRQAWVWWET